MNTVYSYEIKTSEKRLNGQRKRAVAANEPTAKKILMRKFSDDEVKVGRKLLKDAVLINKIELDGTKITKLTDPPDRHQGYCPVINGKIMGEFLHYDTAKSVGGIVVPRKIAVKMYAFV